MQLAMKQDSPMFSSDGGAWAIVKESDAPGISHPRSLAIQARVLSTSVREQKVLAVENAIIISSAHLATARRLESVMVRKCEYCIWRVRSTDAKDNRNNRDTPEVKEDNTDT